MFALHLGLFYAEYASNKLKAIAFLWKKIFKRRNLRYPLPCYSLNSVFLYRELFTSWQIAIHVLCIGDLLKIEFLAEFPLLGNHQHYIFILFRTLMLSFTFIRQGLLSKTHVWLCNAIGAYLWMLVATGQCCRRQKYKLCNLLICQVRDCCKLLTLCLSTTSCRVVFLSLWWAAMRWWRSPGGRSEGVSTPGEWLKVRILTHESLILTLFFNTCLKICGSYL